MYGVRILQRVQKVGIIEPTMKTIIQPEAPLTREQIRRLQCERLQPRNEVVILVEGGVVHEVVNLPANTNLTIIDYDVDGVEQERIQASPVDGEPCVINKW